MSARQHPGGGAGAALVALTCLLAAGLVGEPQAQASVALERQIAQLEAQIEAYRQQLQEVEAMVQDLQWAIAAAHEWQKDELEPQLERAQANVKDVEEEIARLEDLLRRLKELLAREEQRDTDHAGSRLARETGQSLTASERGTRVSAADRSMLGAIGGGEAYEDAAGGGQGRKPTTDFSAAAGSTGRSDMMSTWPVFGGSASSDSTDTSTLGSSGGFWSDSSLGEGGSAGLSSGTSEGSALLGDASMGASGTSQTSSSTSSSTGTMGTTSSLTSEADTSSSGGTAGGTAASLVAGMLGGDGCSWPGAPQCQYW